MSMQFALGPAEAAVERGHYNYVLVQDSLLKEVVPILPFDAIDGVEGLCLPNNVIEYTYARVLAPAADALDDEFGVSCLDVAVFNGVEVALRALARDNSFDVSPCSFPEYLRRLSELPHNSAFTCSASDLIANEHAPDGISVHEHWLDFVKISDLVDSSGRLAPYADLAGLLGPRNLFASRRLVAPASRFAKVAAALLKKVRAAYGLDEAPDNGAVLLVKPDDTTGTGAGTNRY